MPALRPILVSDLLTLRLGTGAIMTPGNYPIVQAMNERGVGVGPELPKAPNADTWLQALGSLPLIHQPGEVWMYDTGITVLGALLARASGQPLETFLRERLFEPLGMKDTGFSVPDDKLDRLPTTYFRNPETKEFIVFDPPTSPGIPEGSAGMAATAPPATGTPRLD